MDPQAIRRERISTGRFTFDCLLAGVAGQPPIILLHGWPECSYLWTPLIRSLSQQGYFCVAPDLRGYSAGARPWSKKAYDIRILVQDTFDLADALELEKFYLIGHDWGAAIGWSVATSTRVRAWTALSVPHPSSLGEAIQRDPEQAQKSQYMRLFQTPVLPEWRLKRNNFKLLRKIWRDSSPEQIEAYLKIFRQRGAMRASLQYYRQNYRHFQSTTSGDDPTKITAPTLFLWGSKDRAIGRSAVENQERFVAGPYRFAALDTNHWMVQNAYPEVEQHIRAHLAEFYPSK